MTESSPYQFLGNHAPFDSLPEIRLRQLADSCSVRKLSNREYLFVEGDECRACYFVLDGRIALIKGSRSAKELMVALFGQGEPFALMSAIENKPFPVSARAGGSSQVLILPRIELLSLWEEFPEVRGVCMAYVSSRMSRLLEFARSLAHDSADVRLSAVILSLIAQGGNEASMDVRILRRDLADLAGTTVETASRVTKRMEAEQVLDLSTHGVVRVLDIEGLRNLAVAEDL